MPTIRGRTNTTRVTHTIKDQNNANSKTKDRHYSSHTYCPRTRIAPTVRLRTDTTVVIHTIKDQNNANSKTKDRHYRSHTYCPRTRIAPTVRLRTNMQNENSYCIIDFWNIIINLGQPDENYLDRFKLHFRVYIHFTIIFICFCPVV